MPFALAEVEALDVKHSGNHVNEEEAYDSSVDVDDVIDVDLEEAHHEAHSHDKQKVYDFAHFYLSLLRLLDLKDMEYSASGWLEKYLLMRVNSGKTEYRWMR